MSTGALEGRTRRIGTRVLRRTDSATLPKMIRPSPLRPCELITMTSTFWTLAASTMDDGAGPYQAWVSISIRPGSAFLELLLDFAEVVFGLAHRPDLGANDVCSRQYPRVCRSHEDEGRTGVRHLQRRGKRRLGHLRAIERNQNPVGFHCFLLDHPGSATAVPGEISNENTELQLRVAGE